MTLHLALNHCSIWNCGRQLQHWRRGCYVIANLVSYAFLWWRVGEWGAAREGNTKISGIGFGAGRLLANVRWHRHPSHSMWVADSQHKIKLCAHSPQLFWRSCVRICSRHPLSFVRYDACPYYLLSITFVTLTEPLYGGSHVHKGRPIN